MGSGRSEVREAVKNKATTRGWRAALVEMLIILTLYVAYSGSRMFASDALRPAQRRAAELLDIESALHLSWEGAHQPGLRRQPRAEPVRQLLVRHRPLRRHRRRAGLALPPRRRRLRARPPRPAGRHDHRAGRLPAAADRPAPAVRRVRRRAGADVGRRVVGRRRLGTQGTRRPDQPAGGLPVAARRLGAVGGDGAAAPRPGHWLGPLDADRRLAARPDHRAGRHRHRQPLGRRRADRVAGDLAGLQDHLRLRRRPPPRGA